MTETKTAAPGPLGPILRRKLVAPPPAGAPGLAPLETALKVAMPRAADELLGLDVEVAGVSGGSMPLAEVLAGLEESHLLFPLIRDGAGAGLATLDAGLRAALIEVQMTGRVSPAPPPLRRPTRTDGVVASDLVDRWLADLATDEADAERGLWPALGGYVRDRGTIDRRAAELTLDPCRFRWLSVRMVLGGGAKTGVFRIYRPDPGGATTSGEAEEATLGARFWAQMQDCPAEMRVILTRVDVPLSRVLRFAPGDTVPVPEDALRRVEVEGLPGHTIARARLGQMRGLRAIRLSGDTMAGDRGAGAQVKSSVSPALVAPGEELRELAEQTTAAEGRGATIGAAVPDASGAATGTKVKGPGGSDLPEPPDLPELPELPGLPDLPAPQDAGVAT